MVTFPDAVYNPQINTPQDVALLLRSTNQINDKQIHRYIFTFIFILMVFNPRIHQAFFTYSYKIQHDLIKAFAVVILVALMDVVIK